MMVMVMGSESERRSADYKTKSDEIRIGTVCQSEETKNPVMRLFYTLCGFVGGYDARTR